MTAQETSTNSKTYNSTQEMLDKILELQEKLVEAQEKNLVLSTQLREMEMILRDGEDLKAEIENQGVILADKSRENKQLHQDLARISATLEEKLREIEELATVNSDLKEQIKKRENERDLLAVMLREQEQEAQKFNVDSLDDDRKPKGWLDRLKGGT